MRPGASQNPAVSIPQEVTKQKNLFDRRTLYRKQKVEERIVYFYVTDHEGSLVGVAPTRRLLLSDASRSWRSDS